MVGRCVFAALLLGALVPVASSQPDVPPLTGRVVDRADILSSHVEDGLATRLAAFEDSTGAQVVVLTVPSLNGEVLEAYATTVFRTWGLGQAGSDNGVLLLVARDDRELRIEVGYGLEGELTDARAGQIIRNEIVPLFKAGDFDAGVLSGVEAILGSIEGTYVPSEDASDEGLDAFGVILILFVPIWGLVGVLRNGVAGSDGDIAVAFSGAFSGGFIGLMASLITDTWWWMGLVLLVPLVLIPLNRYLESHPRYGPARRERRRTAAIIAAARRAGKSSVVINGVTHRVPSGSSGGFSGGGGSSGGGGASGSW